MNAKKLLKLRPCVPLAWVELLEFGECYRGKSFRSASVLAHRVVARLWQTIWLLKCVLILNCLPGGARGCCSLLLINHLGMSKAKEGEMNIWGVISTWQETSFYPERQMTSNDVLPKPVHWNTHAQLHNVVDIIHHKPIEWPRKVWTMRDLHSVFRSSRSAALLGWHCQPLCCFTWHSTISVSSRWHPTPLNFESARGY